MTILSDLRDRATDLMRQYHAAKRDGKLREAQEYWEQSKFFLMLIAEAEEDDMAEVET